MIRRKKERNIWFTQPMREDLGVYFSIIQEAYFITHNNLTSDREGLPQREDRRIRMQACHPAFDIKELLCAQIGAESSLRDGDICHFQCHFRCLYTVAAVGDIGEGAAVDKRRRMLQCLDHIGL